jgi:hypothetical protein
MANPCHFKEANFVYKAPPDPETGTPMTDCGDLHVCRGEAGGVRFNVSCWQLTEAEIADVVKTGKVYLYVYGPSHPVVGLDTRLV